MPIFQGTIQEFHHFIGPRIRNKVNGITRNDRLARNGVCEFCGKNAVLESAHVDGKGRRTIIESILKPLENPNGEVKCEIREIECQIIDAHRPVEDTFRFICKPCHKGYDSNNSLPKPTNSRQNISTLGIPEFTKISKIRRWANNPHQANHKFIQAYLSFKYPEEVSRESFERKCVKKFKIKKFQAHFASMKTDAGNSHGAVFYEEKGKVKMWKIVRKEVDVHFK